MNQPERLISYTAIAAIALILIGVALTLSGCGTIRDCLSDIGCR